MTCCQTSWWALVQVMAWCFTSIKPLPEPMLSYCQLDPEEQFHWNFNQTTENELSSANCQPFSSKPLFVNPLVSIEITSEIMPHSSYFYHIWKLMIHECHIFSFIWFPAWVRQVSWRAWDNGHRGWAAQTGKWKFIFSFVCKIPIGNVTLVAITETTVLLPYLFKGCVSLDPS